MFLKILSSLALANSFIFFVVQLCIEISDFSIKTHKNHESWFLFTKTKSQVFLSLSLVICFSHICPSCIKGGMEPVSAQHTFLSAKG